MELGIATVAAVTALVYIVGMAVKASAVNDKWIPVICGIVGIVLGVVAMYLGVPDFPAEDPLTAAAVGGMSGLAAVGIDQIGKQLKKEE